MKNNRSKNIAEVVIEVTAKAIDRAFDYQIPASILDEVQVGSRVIVPFGLRKVQGYVILLKEETDKEVKLREIEQVLDELAPLTSELIELGKWMSKEYVCFLITALQAMLPASLKSKTVKHVQKEAGQEQISYEVKDNITKKLVSVVQLAFSPEVLLEKNRKHFTTRSKTENRVEFLVEQQIPLRLSEVLERCGTTRQTVMQLQEQGFIEVVQEEVRRDPYEQRSFPRTKALELTLEQQTAYSTIINSVDLNESQTILLHGVTGSGKTEIYLQSISYVLELEKEAIVLVPEISLTPQMVERFKGRFGDEVAVLHSRLSAGERYDEWRRIRKGQVKVAIGARSALFAPFTNLGLIIIDEEHEGSYKQEENPKYHARDIAIFRGQYHQAPIILGSATPVLESYARAQKGVYQLISLEERVHGRELPPVHIVDMREELHQGNRSMFSKALYAGIEERLQKKEQIVLFLNRRGFSTFVMCRDCGYVVECPHCDISLTYHKNNHTLRCHYCGYTESLMTECPQCQSNHIRFFGTGTQKVEEELYKLFPEIRIIRMDVDTTQRKGSHERLLEKFKQKKADVLLGTQMIAKGLDFEDVTLVGVISADSMLHLPDFRAAERTFQLLTQVSGRAGRHQLPGEVFIQTYTPEHYSIQTAAGHDYQQFYQLEMQMRHKMGYPPYYYLTILTFSHEDLATLVAVCEQSVTWLKQQISSGTFVMGPVASPIPRVKDRYRYQCMIKYRNEPNLSKILELLLDRLSSKIQQNQLQVQIDMRP